MLAHVAYGSIKNRIVALGERAILARNVFTGLALVIARGNVHANRRKGLVGIVASGNRFVTDAERVLAIGDILQRDVLKATAFLGDNHEVVLEHIHARALVNVALFDRSVHGALRGGNQQIGIRAGTEHFIQLARRLVLRVGKRNIAVAILDVGSLNFFHRLGERIRRENLQLYRFGRGFS